VVAFSLTGFLLAAVNFWAAAAASSFPAATDYPGWVALIQPESQFAAKGQVTLGVRPLVPGGAGAQPLIEVVVTACGRGRFDGQLLLAGTTGYVQPESAPSTGLRVDTLRKASLTDVGFGTEVDLAGVRRVRFGTENLEDCVPGIQGGQVPLASFVTRLDHPTLLRERSLWFEAARQVQSWPMLGAVPAFNVLSLGQFDGTGDLAGAWDRPASLSVDLGVGTLGAWSLVDSSSPPLTASDNAHWHQATPFRAKLSLVDQGSVAMLQNWLSISGIFIGVFGSVVATLLLGVGLSSGQSETRDAPPRVKRPGGTVLIPRPSHRWTFVPMVALVLIALRRALRNR